ncbi:MAG: 2,3-butanediol dehydrogenase [Acidimicrobiales bacterium]
MKAAVYHGREDVRIEDVPEPEVEPGHVKISVPHNGICGTDLHEFFWGPVFIPTPEAPHPLTGAHLPVVIGHEFGGTVVEVGEGVDDLAVGDLVAVEPIEWCNECPQCLAGHYNLCPKIAFHGVHRHGGGLAEYTVIPRRMAHKAPDGVGPELAALAEPMCVAFHGVVRAQLEPGQTAVVHGAGPIGIGAYLGLRAEGIDDVIVVEPSPTRRAAVEKLGAPVVLDPGADDVAAAIMSHTRGKGADAQLDAAGVPASLNAAIASTAAHGRVITIAVFPEPVQFNPNDILFREVVMTSSMAYKDDYPRVLEHMANGRYPMDGWVTHIAMDDLVNEGIMVLRDQKAMKIMVDIGG